MTVLNGSGGEALSDFMLPDLSKTKARSSGLLQASTPKSNGLGQVKTKSCLLPLCNWSTNVLEAATTFSLLSRTKTVSSSSGIVVIELLVIVPFILGDVDVDVSVP